MSYYASLLGPSAVEQFKPIGVCFGLIAAAHTFELSQMVFHSLRLRRLVLDAPPAPALRQSRVNTVEGSHAMTQPTSRVHYAFSVLHAKWARFFHRRGFFGVESDFFHARFVFRELVEIVSQTAQVYTSSVLIAKVWINNLYVVLMLVNCCSTPALQATFYKSPALERLLCLCVDFVLDAVVSMVVPIIILYPYYDKFDLASYNFEISYLYDDIWFANMVMENQQIFALTSWDFLWKIVPHLSMYSCLSSLNALVRPARFGSSTSSLASTSRFTNHSQWGSASRNSSRAVTPVDDGGESSFQQAVAQVGGCPIHPSQQIGDEKLEESPATPRRRGWLRRRPRKTMRTKGKSVLKGANAAMILWGLGILALHLMAIRASLGVDVPGCKQTTRPWFATKYSCSVLQYNCHQYNTTGVRLEDIDILQEQSVAALVFSHCADLHIPPHIQQFRNLLGVDIFNSTLTQWSLDAAITAATHPRLTYIIFVRVNLTRLPDGVLEPLPPSMTDFEIAVTNLTQLPDDLHERWHPMALLYVEHSQIATFPPALLHLGVDDFSLIGSFVTELPDFPADHPGFYTIAMSHTPLAKLPDRIGGTAGIGFMNLGHTNLRSFPEWMEKAAKTATKIYVHDTPFCADKSDEKITHKYGVDAVLSCVDTEDRPDGKYPLELMGPRRPYDPPPATS